MSELYPGMNAMPATPAPWLPSELVLPTPKRWGSVAVRRPYALRRLVFFAIAIVAAWALRDVFAFWFLAPIFFGGPRCCWW